MSVLRRFAADEQARIERAEEGERNTDVETSALTAIDEAMHPENPSPLDEVAVAPAEPPARGLQRARASTTAPAPAHRAVTDTLVLLKSLAPVLRAALLFPGPDVSSAEFGVAVGRMSTAVAQLTELIARESDPLELDSRWARKSLQEVAAELVAHHWVSAVIARGGMSAEELPDLPVDRFAIAVREVLRLPMDLSGAKEHFNLSYGGSIRLSFLKAFAPLAVEIERYSEVVNRRLETRVVDGEALQAFIGQLLMDQALSAQESLTGADVDEDEKRMTLQACLAHAGTLFLAAWEPTRGDALGMLVDAASLDEGRAALNGLSCQHGFPVEAFKRRALHAMQRLVGTTQAAMTMVRAAHDHSQRREG